MISIYWIKNSFFIGVEAGIFFTTIFVILSVGSVSSLRVGQLYSISQLYRCKVGNCCIHFPNKTFIRLSVSTVCIIFYDKVIIRILGSLFMIVIAAISKAISSCDIRVTKLRISNTFFRDSFSTNFDIDIFNFINKIKVVLVASIVNTFTDHVNYLASSIQQIIDIILDFSKRNFFTICKIVHERRSPWMNFSICFTRIT